MLNKLRHAAPPKAVTKPCDTHTYVPVTAHLNLEQQTQHSENQLERSSAISNHNYSCINHKSWVSVLVPQEADLVTTHELGHNFGAEHDPDDMPDCAPREDQGGKYVMYPIAVSGDHFNNKVTSHDGPGVSCVSSVLSRFDW